MRNEIIRNVLKVIYVGWLISFIATSTLVYAESSLNIDNQARKMELQVFGKVLGTDVESLQAATKKTFMLNIISSLYVINTKYNDYLRLCEIKEKIANSDHEVDAAKECRLNALIKLDRNHEVEQLLYLNPQLLPLSEGGDDKEQAQRWFRLAVLNAKLGNKKLTEYSFDKGLSRVQAARAKIFLDPETLLIPGLPKYLDGVLQGEENSANLWLANIAFERQDYLRYERYFEKVLLASKQDERARKFIDQAWILKTSNRLESKSLEIIAKGLLSLKANAGFKNQKEPLREFVIHDSVSAVIGSPTQTLMYVNDWLRLVKAYYLLDRRPEAQLLLSDARKLASQYLLLPETHNLALAEIDEIQADISLDTGANVDSMIHFQSASRRLKAIERANVSTTTAQRSTPIGDDLTRLRFKQLSLWARLARSMPAQAFTKPQEIQQILELLNEVSISRLKLSSSQLAHRLNADNEVGGLKAEQGKLIQKFIELRGQLDDVLLIERSSASQVLINQLSREITTILFQIESLQKEIDDRRVINSQLTSQDVMRLLKVNEVYWQWVLSPYGNVSVALHQDGLHISSIDAPIFDLRQKIDKLYQASDLRSVEGLRNLKPYPTQTAHEVYQTLFGALAPQLPSHKKNWLLAPEADLDKIPWAALVTKTSNTGLSEPHWLILQTSIGLVPSWSVLVQLRQLPATKGSKAFFGIGAAQNSALFKLVDLPKKGGSFVDAKMPPSTMTQISPPFLSEIHQAAKKFPANQVRTLTGIDALKTKLMSEPLNDYRVLLFSTHGYLAGAVNSSLGPSLELTEQIKIPLSRWLTATEITKLKLDADLVILSACYAAGSDGTLNAEGFSGLTNAFVFAGSRNVLATLWPVEVKATEFVVLKTLDVFQQPSATKKSMAVVLQQAQIQYLQRAGTTISKHPAFWAAFVMVGA